MSHTGDWGVWGQRMAGLWAESLSGASIVPGEDGLPVLKVDGFPLPLAPSHWGFPSEGGDMAHIENALETIVQGHAPDYWKESGDPLVQALGWLDRRIGKRSWRHRDEVHGVAARNPLEQQMRAIRDHADMRISVAPPRKTPRVAG